MSIEDTFDRCAPSFHRYFSVRAGGDEHVVDDLMQQLWLQLQQNGSRVAADKSEPWLWRVAQNLIRLHWRTRSRQADRLPTADPELARHLAERFDTEVIPPDVLSLRETREQLLLALTSLPSAQQELLVGHYFEGQTLAALATRMATSERAVEGRLYRARKSLRDRLAHLIEPGDPS